jgi:hypothetical protein
LHFFCQLDSCDAAEIAKTAPILLIACLISDTVLKRNFQNSRTKMIEKIYKIEVETCKKSGRIEFVLSRPILNHDEKQKLQLLLAQGGKFALRIRFIAKKSESEANSLRFASQKI